MSTRDRKQTDKNIVVIINTDFGQITRDVWVGFIKALKCVCFGCGILTNRSLPWNADSRGGVNGINFGAK